MDIEHVLSDASIMAAQKSSEETPQKGPKYPYYPMSSALRIAEAVKDLGGARTPITKSLLAKHLKEEESSTAFSQQLTSAKIFGVIEGFGSYVLTEIAKHLYFPTSESDKANAMIDIFMAPPAYQELIKRFDGNRIPTKDILGNIMHRELNVPESWKDRSAALFLNSAQYVGVTDSDGILRVNANRHEVAHAEDRTDAEVLPARRDSAVDQSPPKTSAPEVRGVVVGKVHWRFKSIEVLTPEDLDHVLWEKLEGYVKLLEPAK